MGGSGSGKSYLRRKLGARIIAAHIDKDLINDAWVPGDRESDFYREFVARQSYDASYFLTAENLKNGVSVFLDAPHLTHVVREDWRKKMEQMAKDQGARLCIIEVLVSEETQKKRICQRNEPRDAWKTTSEENWKRFVRKDTPNKLIEWDGKEVIYVRLDVELSDAKLDEIVQRICAA